MDTPRQTPHVVIVGAGFGGLSAARRLATTPVQVTLIDRHNYHLFQPLLYQVATAGLSPAQVAAPIRQVLRRCRNVRVLMEEVQAIDLQARQAATASRDIEYDYLVLAPGARSNYFGHDDWERWAPSLKTVEDATAIRSRILYAFERGEMAETEAERKRLMTFVLVGGGPTGVEMAGAIAELAKRALVSDFRAIDPSSADIILLEAGPRLMTSFPEHLSRYAERALERMGVQVHCNSPVEAVDGEAVTLLGKRLEAGTVIWCTGVKAENLGGRLGAELDAIGRVVVRQDLSVPGHPEAFVIGDAALAVSAEGEPLPALAPVAKQQGAFVAEVIRRRVARDSREMSFRYRDAGQLATIGRSHAVVDFGWLRLRGWLGWLVWCIAHIYYLIGFRNRLVVFIDWAWAYVTFARGARLITGTVDEVAAPAKGGRAPDTGLHH